MAKEDSNKFDENESAEGISSAAFGVESFGPRPEGRTRRGRSVATLEVGEGPFVGVSVDAFAVPSELPLERNEDPARVLSGPEPAVFGGVNPPSPSGAVNDPDAQPPAPTIGEQIGGALDEAVQTGDLLADVPKIDYVRVIRSTPFLLCTMVVLLVAATVIIRLVVETQTYVQTTVHFNNYTKLNEQEQGELQAEINKVLRSLPLRRQAWEILQKKAPDQPQGFLNSGLTFHRLGAIEWLGKDHEGVMQLRVDSEDPAADLIRLRAVSEAFYSQMDDRNQKKDEYRDTLKGLEQQKVELAREDEKLKKEIEDLLPEAQKYADLKQSMQAMERYLEVADESNPLRVVARQNLARITTQVDEARQLSIKRDNGTAKRMAQQKKAAETGEAIARLQRQIELFPWPDPPDAKTLSVYDTRPRQTTVLRSAWISIIALTGLIILLIHLQDQRSDAAARRERREKLKAQQQQQSEQVEP